MWRLNDVEARLTAALASTLPGVVAHERLAPRPRPGWRPGFAPEQSRVAAGLVLLFPVEGEAFIVLTVRSSRLPSHAGQVSLPGGAVEEGETLERAALREAHEEVGLEPSCVRLVGRLTPLHIPVSGFILHPVVGIADGRPVLRPSDAEVDRILEVPLASLVDPARRAVKRRAFEGTDFEIPYIDVDGAELWGATAMVVSELLSLLEG